MDEELSSRLLERRHCCLHRWVTVVGLFLHADGDDVGDGLRARRRSLSNGCGRAEKMPTQNAFQRVTIKGHGTTEHLVQDDAQGVDVGAVVDRFTPSLLGGHVVRCAHDRAGHRQLGCAQAVGELGDAEVQQLAAEATIVPHVDGNVVRLDIPMGDSGAVGGCQARAEVDGEIEGDARRKRAPLQQPSQVVAIEVFHDEIVAAVELPKVDDVDHIRAVDGRCGPCLAHESLGQLGGCRQVVAQHFDGHGLADDMVVPPVDVAHGSFA